VVGQSEEDISDCKILRHVATATKFGQNRLKSRKIGANLSYMRYSAIGTFHIKSL